MTISLFRSTPEGYWPAASMLTLLKRTYDDVSHIEDDLNTRFYRVTHKGLTFLAVLVHAESDREKIVEFALIAYFSGFPTGTPLIEQLNRSLHNSVAEVMDSGDMVLFSFQEATGPFDENRFSLLLGAWQRDIILTLKMLTPEESIGSAYSGKALSLARSLNNKIALDTQPTGMDGPEAASAVHFSGESLPNDPASAPTPTPSPAPVHRNAAFNTDPSAILKRFLGAKDASRSLCQTCEGRGRIGFPSRQCKPCQGSGLTRANV